MLLCVPLHPSVLKFGVKMILFKFGCQYTSVLFHFIPEYPWRCSPLCFFILNPTDLLGWCSKKQETASALMDERTATGTQWSSECICSQSSVRFRDNGVKIKTRREREVEEWRKEEGGGVENQWRVKNSTECRRSWGEKRSSKGSNQQLSVPISRDQALLADLLECWRISLFFILFYFLNIRMFGNV